MAVIDTTSPSSIIATALGNSYSYGQSTSGAMRSILQDKINSEWQYAPDIYTIEEEYNFGSEEYNNVEVRLNHVTDNNLVEKLGEDFKKIIFRDIGHQTGLGYKYRFDNNYWLATSFDRYRNTTTSVVVRRCNNVLRWYTPEKHYVEEPCILEYKIQSSRNFNSTNLVLPEGSITVHAQHNEKTRHIRPNQRFLFGNDLNFTGYKVLGGGIRNFLNLETTNNNSATLLDLYMEVNYVNYDTDDTSRGIADYLDINYRIEVSPTSIVGNIGDTIALYPVVYYNGKPTTKNVFYQSLDSGVASTSGNLVTINSNSGSTIIKVILSDNSDVFVDVPVTATVSPISDSEIRTLPNPDYILQGDSKTYNTVLYVNGIPQPDTFNFEIVDSGVSPSKYDFKILSGNSFYVKNIEMDLYNPLIIKCTAGTVERDISIVLKGSW